MTRREEAMNDYEPIDLSEWCNSGTEALPDDEEPLTGSQTFQGLPFLVGGKDTDGGRCYITLDGSSSAVTIPVNQEARSVIFAQRLIDSELRTSGNIGAHVADYVFRLEGGQQVTVPIRERFELAAVIRPGDINGVPGLPYRAATDRMHALTPRDEGPWEAAGRRQTETVPATARSYFLWPWTNPEAGAAIESIEIIPRGPRFLIAAITLGHADENPFVKQGRRPVRIALKDGNSQTPSDLEVEVDRGHATYAFPLPSASAEEFVTDPYKGWGEAQNEGTNPAYVEIAATPSATVTVGKDEKFRWGDLEEKGSVETPRMRIDLLDPGKNWVHVTVLDDDTGRPVPCRVHFRSPEGVPYQPHGHHNQVNSNQGTWHIDVGGDLRLGQITYAYIDGACQGWLPRGEVIVDVARGFEYEPLRARVNIEPGQRELTLRIKRWINMNDRRWFSGDSHVHFLSTQGSHTESQGEDLNVVNLLQSQWGSLFTNTEEFIGAPSVSQVGNNIVYTSQENRQHFMGHMILWGLKKPVMPWCSDGPSEAEIGGTMETTLSYWADEAHAQGGFAINPHFPMPNGEQAALIATGRLDAVEMIRQTRINHLEYYRYLNAGYRLPLVGGTDKMSSDVPVGMYRTYAYIPEDQEFSYDNWCRSVAAGRTTLSGGPILHFSVDGHQIGDTAQLSGAGTVEVEAWAESIFPIYKLEIIQEGRVVATSEDPKGTRRLALKEKIKVDGHTWLAARCGAPDYYTPIPHHDVWSRGIFAHTSPIYVAVGGEWQMFNEDVARNMLGLIDGDLTYIREMAPMHASGTVTHHHGEGDHLAYLQRPFLEAQDAVQKKMRGAGLSS
jgi:hypothetical protein